MDLLDIFPRSRIVLDLKARDKKGAIREVVQHLVSADLVAEDLAKKLEKAVLNRENQGSTGIGKGLAIPHAKDCSFLSEVIAVFARSQIGIPFNSVDGELVHLVFLVVSPSDFSDKHLLVMKKIAALHRDDKSLKFLRTTQSVESILEILKEIDENYK